MPSVLLKSNLLEKSSKLDLFKFSSKYLHYISTHLVKLRSIICSWSSRIRHTRRSFWCKFSEWKCNKYMYMVVFHISFSAFLFKLDQKKKNFISQFWIFLFVDTTVVVCVKILVVKEAFKNLCLHVKWYHFFYCSQHVVVKRNLLLILFPLELPYSYILEFCCFF